jgi:hypothetical protein
VIVEPKPKKKIVVTEAAPKKAKKIVVASTEAPAEQAIIADAAPVVETPDEEQATTEAPAEEQAVAETPAAPEQKFEIGQIIKAGDGISYVIVSINETGVSVLPLSAFAEYQPVKKVYKKKRYKKRYSSYRSYGGSSCH